MSILRTKSVDDLNRQIHSGEKKLARHLNAMHLTMIGVGGVIGAGIFVLTGTASAMTGPAIVLSFILSATGCGLAGLCYAELSSMIPVAGSAYTYAYATLGEIFAWITGWALVLEYAVGSVAVAVGWSGYFTKLFETYGYHMPASLTRGYFDGGIINLPAVLLVALVCFILIRGVRGSARFTTFLVWLKFIIILVFLWKGTPHVKPELWHPFMPFGWAGVLRGAGLIFFAYIGFDAVTTTSEETINPQRDIPIGIFASLIICTILYIIVAGVLTGMVPYNQLNVREPVAMALEHVGITWAVKFVAAGASVGLASVVMVLMTGQPRILFAMSRDGLISPWFSKVHSTFHTPYRAILTTGLFVAIFAGSVPVGAASEMTAAGTLFAFIIVCVGVMVLRKTRPDLHRTFRVWGNPVIPTLGALVCFGIMMGLSGTTWKGFLGWMAFGLIVYFTYSRKHARLALKEGAEPQAAAITTPTPTN